MAEEKKLTGYPSIDKPWLKYYSGIAPSIAGPNCSMWEFLYNCNSDKLKYIALNYFGRKITYGELFENIDLVARSLCSLGVKQGDIVSICPLNTPEFIYLLYAVNKLGAVSNWIGLTSPVSDLHEQLTSTDTRFVFTVSLAYEQIAKAAEGSNVERIITVPIENSMPVLYKTLLSYKNRRFNRSGICWGDFINSPGSKTEVVDIEPYSMAMIEYTGGSTGVPKGVMLSNKAINSYYVNFAKTNHCGITSYNAHDKFLSGVPLFLAFGVSSCCHGPLCHSMELILSPDPNPKAGTKMILKSKVSHIIAGRIMIEALIESAQKTNADLSFVRSIMYGGEETNKTWERSAMERLKNHNVNAPLLNGYGMTETSAAILVAPDNDTDGLIPLGNVNVKIVDPDDETREYRYNTEGELCLSADTIMNGYYRNEKETKDVIFEVYGTRWLKTHDLAVISPDGVIKITGRIKRIYSRLTQDRIQIRVYPMRIEETLLKNELVQKCAVVGVKDDILAYRSIAYIILSDKAMDSDRAKELLNQYCRTNLPDSHWPDEYVFMQTLPYTRAGKVDYRTLEEMAKEDTAHA